MSDVRQDVLKCFEKGEQLGAYEVMQRTGRGRVVYRWLQRLVQEGMLEVVRTEPGMAPVKRRHRKVFAATRPIRRKAVPESSP